MLGHFDHGSTIMRAKGLLWSKGPHGRFTEGVKGWTIRKESQALFKGATISWWRWISRGNVVVVLMMTMPNVSEKASHKHHSTTAKRSHSLAKVCWGWRCCWVDELWLPLDKMSRQQDQWAASVQCTLCSFQLRQTNRGQTNRGWYRQCHEHVDDKQSQRDEGAAALPRVADDFKDNVTPLPSSVHSSTDKTQRWEQWQWHMTHAF